MGIRSQQVALVDQLVAAGIRATDDPARADAGRPCVLVAAPRLDFTALAYEHSLVVLAGHDNASVAALEQLDELIARVENVLPIETAEPIGYQLTSGPLVPAYLLRVTT